jgi:hypothetical protein
MSINYMRKWVDEGRKEGWEGIREGRLQTASL